jgi:hypothetical protein
VTLLTSGGMVQAGNADERPDVPTRL